MSAQFFRASRPGWRGSPNWTQSIAHAATTRCPHKTLSGSYSMHNRRKEKHIEGNVEAEMRDNPLLKTPAEQRGRAAPRIALLRQFSWQAHCHGLCHTPVAALSAIRH